MPKARFAIQPGTVTRQFHDPIEPAEFGNRDCLMAKVRNVINRGLPQELREKIVSSPRVKEVRRP